MAARGKTCHRAAVIGCGRIGSLYNEIKPGGDIYSHAAAYLRHPRTELVALADADVGRAAAAAAYWRVTNAHADAAEMLNRHAPEIVSICSPDALHGAHLALALAAPATRAILCEKPVVLDPREGEALLARAEKFGIHLSVNHIRRFDRGHKKVGEMIRGAALGTIQSVIGHYSGGVTHNGSHMLDLFCHWFGEVEELGAVDRLGEPGRDPTLDVALRFRSGPTAHMIGHDSRAFHIFEIDILGDDGRLRFTETGHRITHQAITASERYLGARELGAARVLSRRMKDTTLHAVEDLVACIDGRRPASACPARDALAATALAARAIAAARPAPARMARG
jgi:predicted dehydrogenase